VCVSAAHEGRGPSGSIRGGQQGTKEKKKKVVPAPAPCFLSRRSRPWPAKGSERRHHRSRVPGPHRRKKIKKSGLSAQRRLTKKTGHHHSLGEEKKKKKGKHDAERMLDLRRPELLGVRLKTASAPTHDPRTAMSTRGGERREKEKKACSVSSHHRARAPRRVVGALSPSLRDRRKSEKGKKKGGKRAPTGPFRFLSLAQPVALSRGQKEETKRKGVHDILATRD